MNQSAPSGLPANACMIPRADRLNGDPARGWYFAVLVRANMLRLGVPGGT